MPSPAAVCLLLIFIAAFVWFAYYRTQMTVADQQDAIVLGVGLVVATVVFGCILAACYMTHIYPVLAS